MPVVSFRKRKGSSIFRRANPLYEGRISEGRTPDTIYEKVIPAYNLKNFSLFEYYNQQILYSLFSLSIVTYPAIWRCGVSCGKCGCEYGGCASLVENDRISCGRFARISKFRDM
jgi:hypothetical protein